jgi:hypothetical protein
MDSRGLREQVQLLVAYVYIAGCSLNEYLIDECIKNLVLETRVPEKARPC